MYMHFIHQWWQRVGARGARAPPPPLLSIKVCASALLVTDNDLESTIMYH